MSGYNGYSNYETWAVCLWLDNDPGSYEYWRERARDLSDGTTDRDSAIWTLADQIEEEHGEAVPHLSTGTVYGDLLTRSLAQVDWREVAETRFDEEVTP